MDIKEMVVTDTKDTMNLSITNHRTSLNMESRTQRPRIITANGNTETEMSSRENTLWMKLMAPNTLSSSHQTRKQDSPYKRRESDTLIIHMEIMNIIKNWLFFCDMKETNPIKITRKYDLSDVVRFEAQISSCLKAASKISFSFILQRQKFIDKRIDFCRSFLFIDHFLKFYIQKI